MKKIIEWFKQIPKDKIMHFGLSSLITIFAGHMALRFTTDPVVAIGTGASVGMLCGILKEVIDSFDSDNKFSWSDLLADLLGCIVGAGLAAIPFI